MYITLASLIKSDVCVLSHVQLFGIPWTVAHQTPLSMEISSQEYWSGLAFPTPGGLTHPDIKPRDTTHITCISCTGRQILYQWATWREAKHSILNKNSNHEINRYSIFKIIEYDPTFEYFDEENDFSMFLMFIEQILYKET